jgi:hypothetical protein
MIAKVSGVNGSTAPSMDVLWAHAFRDAVMVAMVSGGEPRYNDRREATVLFAGLPGGSSGAALLGGTMFETGNRVPRERSGTGAVGHGGMADGVGREADAAKDRRAW